LTKARLQIQEKVLNSDSTPVPCLITYTVCIEFSKLQGLRFVTCFG